MHLITIAPAVDILEAAPQKFMAVDRLMPQEAWLPQPTVVQGHYYSTKVSHGWFLC
jgi:hypothetical protein